jgi:tetratricopeptide (TPR) repeat protein
VPKEISAEERPPPAGTFVDMPRPATKPPPRRPPPPVMVRQAPGAAPQAPAGPATPAGARQVEPAFPEEELAAPAEGGKKPKPKKPRAPGAPASPRLSSLRDRALGFGRALKQRPALLLGLVAGLMVVGVVVAGVRARRTDAGLFWMNRLTPKGKANAGATLEAIRRAGDRLAEGTFSGTRGALAIAAQALKTLPEDEDVRSFFVLCASELKVSYNQSGADLDQARRLGERLKPSDRRQLLAMGALALATGEPARTRVLLSPLVEGRDVEPETIFLYALALQRMGETALATQVLDNALKTLATPKLLVQRGQLAKAKNLLPDAKGWFEKALEKDPKHGRALVELADIQLREHDLASAQATLDRLQDPEMQKSQQLEATEEGRAAMLRAKLSAELHQGKEAAEQFERAVKLDPKSTEIATSFGLFRARRREYDRALPLLETAAAADPANVDVQAALVRTYLGLNRFLDADKRIRDAAQRDPNQPAFMFLQGKVAESIGKMDEAGKAYDKALAKKAQLPEAIAAQGMIEAYKGNKDAARDKLEAARALPMAGQGTLELEAVGDLALTLAEWAKARDQFDAALKVDPEDPLAHAGLGRAMAGLGELKTARAELEIALAGAGQDASVLFEYGSVLRRLGELEPAKAALQKSVKLNDKEARIFARLGAVQVELHEYAEAEKTLKQAVLLDERLGEGLYYLGRSLSAQKKLTEAIDIQRKDVAVEPSSSAAYLQLGYTYEQGEQVANAVDAFTKAVEHDRKSVDGLEHLGMSFLLQNRFAEAIDAFKKGLQLDPERSSLWAAVGDAMQQAGETDGAITNLQKSLKLDPQQSGVWTKLGVAYRDKACGTCKDKALDALTRAVRLNPRDALAWYHLGYLFKDEGKKEEAVAAFRKYIELRPDAPDAPTVKDDIFYLQEERKRTP